MSWNESLYQYHKARGGQFLAGEADDGLLILTWKDRPLAVDLSIVTGGRSGAFSYVRARVPVTLAKPYELTIGAEKALSGGVNTVLKSVSGIAGYSTDFGCPEVTKKRLIRTENIPFTKLALGSLELRNALLAAAVSGLSGDGGGWYLGSREYIAGFATEEEQAREARQVEEEFFPRMDRFLELARAAYNAVTQWPM